MSCRPLVFLFLLTALIGIPNHRFYPWIWDLIETGMGEPVRSRTESSAKVRDTVQPPPLLERISAWMRLKFDAST